MRGNRYDLRAYWNWRAGYFLLLKHLLKVRFEYAIGTLQAMWRIPRHVPHVLKIDLRQRYSTRESVISGIQKYSRLHGGATAKAELSKLYEECGGYVPVPLYRILLRQSGKSPQEIVNFVRTAILHIDGDPAVMEDRGETRPFLPLETALTGIGQCTGAASLAAALFHAAGFEVRLWAVSGHTFFEWRSRRDRWQLEDVDVFPPNVSLPRGLSMRSLLESYADWVPLLDALPTLNVISPSTCFVPTDNGELHCWRHNLYKPYLYDYQINYHVGRVARQLRSIFVEVVKRDGEIYLLVGNPNPQDIILVVCNRPVTNLVKTTFDDLHTQHDVFMFANADGLYDEHLRQVSKKLYFRIKCGAKNTEVSLAGLDTDVVSVFTRSPHNLSAQLFLIKEEVHLPGYAPPSEIGSSSTQGSFPIIQAGQAAYESVLESNDQKIDKSAIRYTQGSMPERAFKVITNAGMPSFHGRVLDAGCGTGAYSIVLADQADHVSSIDYTPERVHLFETVLQKIDPRPHIEPAVGSLENLPYDDCAFDSIFCRGVLFLTDLPRSLSEFFRVLKPGGHVYIDCNADAWNRYLMLERGKDNPDILRQGRDTLYNTAWRRYANTSLPLLKRSVHKYGLGAKIRFGTPKLDNLLQEMDRHICRMSPDDAAKARRLELQSRHLCGDAHLSIIMKDILSVAAGLQQGPSVTVGSQAWEPEEVQEQLERLGFENFEWWSSAGSRGSQGKRPLELGPQLATEGTASMHYQGDLTVWHGLFEKPF